ncbi:hypothetical protein [Flavobacterium selenitireducens]|uniref:hypothetical protein n=1 Tax=Flavobacterium selenitireducens TaxID=2722704 RepID=UPI00168B10C3|nr:hypothetical protein [Flavobacterium selenitireducens]MBD3581193.1 hypothetical protein [Flavobacterium selenitireducens]
MTEEKFVTFKESQTGEPSKIDSDELYSIDLHYTDGIARIFRLYGVDYMFNKPKKADKKTWFGSVYDGSIIWLTQVNNGDIRINNAGTGYFIHDPGTSEAYFFWTKFAGSVKAFGEKKMFKILIERHFATRCPKMVEENKSGTFKTTDIEEVIAYYKSNCDTKK